MIRKLVFLLIWISFVFAGHRQQSPFARSISNKDSGVLDSSKDTIMEISFSEYHNAIVTANRKTLLLSGLTSDRQSSSFDISAGGYHTVIADPLSSKLCGLNNLTKKVDVFSVASGSVRVIRSWDVDIAAPIGSQISAIWHPHTNYLLVRNSASFQLLDVSSPSGEVYGLRKFADILGDTFKAGLRKMQPFGPEGTNQYLTSLIFTPVFYIIDITNPTSFFIAEVNSYTIKDSLSSVLIDSADKNVWYIAHVRSRLAKYRYNGSRNLEKLLEVENFFVPPNPNTRADTLSRAKSDLCDVPRTAYIVFYVDQIIGLVRKSDFAVEFLFDSTSEGLKAEGVPLASPFTVRRGDSIFAPRIMTSASLTETFVVVEEIRSSNQLGTLCPTGQAYFENRCIGLAQIPSGFGACLIDNSVQRCLVEGCVNCSNNFRFCQACQGTSAYDSVQSKCIEPPKPVKPVDPVVACTVANCLVCNNNICSKCDQNTPFKILRRNKCVQANELPADGNGIDPTTNTVKPCALSDCADCRNNFKECNGCKPGFQMSLQQSCSKEGFEGDTPESLVERPFAPENAAALAQVTSIVGQYRFNFLFYVSPAVASPKVSFRPDATMSAFLSSYLTTQNSETLEQVDRSRFGVDASSFHSFTEYVQVKKAADLKAVLYFLLSQNFKYAIDLRSAQIFYDKVKACAERFSVTEFNVPPQIRNSVALVRTQFVVTDCSVKGQNRLLIHSGTGRITSVGESQLKAADLANLDRVIKGQLNRRALDILA